MLRKVVKIIKGDIRSDGAGVKLRRVLNNNTVKEFDPFLMLDGFDSINPDDYTKGFPWHPHRGIETITYLVSGDIEHSDSLGNKGSILDGDCQWMTAGSGIIHQEMPKAVERILGVQLWLNLPKKDKMTKPQYNDLKNINIPLVIEDGVKIKVISGNYKDISGAIKGNFVKMTYLDIAVDKGKKWSFETDSDSTLFIYILLGSLEAEGRNSNVDIDKSSAALFANGNSFEIEAKNGNVRFLLAMAKPLNETIAWGGPIVMNTREELDLAFKEIQENTFIK